MILAYLSLLIAIPLGIMLSKVTKDERNIYRNPPYFPIILWVLAILAAIFYTLDKRIALTLSFLFIMTLVWYKA